MNHTGTGAGPGLAPAGRAGTGRRSARLGERSERSAVTVPTAPQGQSGAAAVALADPRCDRARPSAATAGSATSHRTGTILHPDLEAEQAYIDHAYECLERGRGRATSAPDDGRGRPGGTEQARFEREVIWDTIANRLAQLAPGRRRPSCFGRIDRPSPTTPAARRFYIGRVAVADADQEPVVVDWRAPVAEPFYRATGREPDGPGPPPPLRHPRPHAARHRGRAVRRRARLDARSTADAGITGHGALIAALETARTGRLGDIVATIQGEQDEIIRAPLPGVLVVQGGPGTGKTVVALHRAAYLLYTHRFPLEGQGVLVVGPNRLFLALHRAGAAVARRGRRRAGGARRPRRTTSRVRGRDRGRRRPGQGRPAHGQGARQGRARPRAAAARRPRRRLRPPDPARCTAERSRAHRRRRPPPLPHTTTPAAASSSSEVFAGAGRSRPATPLDADEVARPAPPRPPRCARRSSGCGRCSRPAELLHDLFGSQGAAALGRPAACSPTSEHRRAAPARARVASTRSSGPTTTCRCSTRPAPSSGPRRGPSAAARTTRSAPTATSSSTRPRTSRRCSCACSTRRSLNGSMTVVGDIAQSTGAVGPRRAGTRSSTTCPTAGRPAGPSSPSATASRRRTWRWPPGCCAVAAPDLHAAPLGPRGRRPPPHRRAADAERPRRPVVDAVPRPSSTRSATGNVAVICPASLVDDVGAALDRRRHRARPGHAARASTTRSRSCRSAW